ncbi:MAG: hypothetical protein AAFQ82_04610 [Myxococcota bacterium]
MESNNIGGDVMVANVECDRAHALELAAVEANRDGDHDRVIEIVQSALELEPTRLRLFMILESAYFHLGRLDEASAVQERVLELVESGKADRGNAIQSKLDEMHWLVNVAYGEFARGRSVAHIVEQLKRAAMLERELLAHWCSTSANQRDVPSGRGELTASAAYIAALRQSDRPKDAAEWFRAITEDTYVFTQCLRDFRIAGEHTLNNGIGALVDTDDPADLEYGAEILAMVDRLGGFETALLPLACATLSTRRGELERALRYLSIAMDRADETVVSDGGGDLRTLVWADPNLEPLHGTEEFRALLGERAPAE